MSERPKGELAGTLRALRTAAGLSGAEAGARAGKSQPWISRFENGRLVPSPDDVRLLCRIYRADKATRDRLVRLSHDIRDEAPPARVVMHRAAGRMQERIGRIERQSRRVSTFAPLVVPGLLQNADYARALFATGDEMPPEQQVAALSERLQRQALLHEGDREFVFVLAEGVLRWQLGSPAVMAAQLDHIVAMSRLPAVRVGVVPWKVAADAAPMSGFDLHDHTVAIVGTETATAFITEPADVEAYVLLLRALEKVAVFGDEARGLLGVAATDYRSTL